MDTNSCWEIRKRKNAFDDSVFSEKKYHQKKCSNLCKKLR